MAHNPYPENVGSDKEQAKENPVFLLRAFKFVWLSFRFHPVISCLLTLGLLSAPGALFSFLSGLFFAAPIPSNAAVGERFSNAVGASLVRPIGATVLVSAEAAYRSQFSYQPADNRRPQSGGNLTTQEVRRLESFARANNATLIRFDQPNNRR